MEEKDSCGGGGGADDEVSFSSFLLGLIFFLPFVQPEFSDNLSTCDNIFQMKYSSYFLCVPFFPFLASALPGSLFIENDLRLSLANCKYNLQFAEKPGKIFPMQIRRLYHY